MHIQRKSQFEILFIYLLNDVERFVSQRLDFLYLSLQVFLVEVKTHLLSSVELMILFVLVMFVLILLIYFLAYLLDQFKKSMLVSTN